jgi:ParB-like chromosome segregation protein Spo0J
MSDQNKLVPVTVVPDMEKIPIHEFANLYPEADASEFKGLVESIGKEGILLPVTLIDDGGVKLLDGRHRRSAALKAGHKWKIEDFKMFVGTLADAELYVVSINSLRRHLSKDDKEEMVKKLLVRHPNTSSRKLATICGVSHTTILKLRKPPEDDGKLKALLKAWENAEPVDQEKFVTIHRVDVESYFQKNRPISTLA